MDGEDQNFVSDFEAKRTNPGYGIVLDSGTQERQDMAKEFDSITSDTAAEGGGYANDNATQDVGVEVGAPISSGSDVVVADLPAFDAPSDPEAAPAADDAPDYDNMTFGQAFKRARQEGVKDFSWKGKLFTTKLKSEAAKAITKPVSKKPQALAKDPAMAQDEPVQAAKVPGAAPARAESANGIGPDINPAMRPKPGAPGIYEGAAIGPNTRADVARAIERASSAKVAPMTLQDADGTIRPARSVAELMAAKRNGG